MQRKHRARAGSQDQVTPNPRRNRQLFVYSIAMVVIGLNPMCAHVRKSIEITPFEFIHDTHHMEIVILLGKEN